MTRRISPTLFVAFFGILFGTTLSNSQDTVPPSLESHNAALPNAPSATQATTCTARNGKTCPEWVHKLIGQYPPSPDSGPQPERDPSTVHFWTYRGADDPPLRTTKQVFGSKVFVATHIGGAIAMIVACRNKRSREEWHSEVPAIGAMLGVDYLQFRFIGGPNAVAPAIYEMIHYGIASTR